MKPSLASCLTKALLGISLLMAALLLPARSVTATPILLNGDFGNVQVAGAFSASPADILTPAEFLPVPAQAAAAAVAFLEVPPTRVDITQPIGAKNPVQVSWTFDIDGDGGFDRLEFFFQGRFTCQVMGGEELGLGEAPPTLCTNRGFARGTLQTEVDFLEGNTSVISDRIGRYTDLAGLDGYTFISDSDDGMDAPPLPQTLSCDTTECEDIDPPDVPEPSTLVLLTAGFIALAAFRVSRGGSKRVNGVLG